MARRAPDAAQRRDGRTAWVVGGLLALILLAAFALRARDAAYVFDGGRVFLPGYDPYYHLRRIQHAVAHWPRVPAFDAWVNAPEGADIYWPAGFDLAMATLARLLGAEPWTAEVERVCAWAVPVLGVGVAAAAYWLGRLWGGRAVGLVGGVVAAAAPIAVSVSAVGRVDHDPAVLLCATLGFACILSALRAEGRTRRLAWAAAGGVLTAAGLWMWPGAIVFVMIAAAAFAIRALVAAAPPRWDVPLATMVVAAIVVTVLCTLSASARPGTMSHVFLSGFHVAVAWAGAASQILLYMVARRVPRRRRARLAWGIASQVVLAAIVLPAVAGALRGAGSFVGATADTVVATAGEAQGLFAEGVSGVAADLSWLALAGVPAGLIVLARGFTRWRRPGDWLIVLWLGAFVALGAAQRRFAAAAAVPMGLCIAELCVWLYRNTASVPPVGRWLLRGAFAAAAAYLLATPAERWSQRPYAPNWEMRAVLPALEWLRDQAPSPGDERDLAAQPAFSVLAFWHYGHWLTHVAGQANVACPFGNAEQHQRGLGRSLDFFGARSEAAAAELCSRLGIRYVLVPELPVLLMAAQAGADPREPLAQQRLMVSSLHAWDGLAAPDHFGPLRHFRLVAKFSARWPGGRPYTTRVFEYVRGAVVTGRAEGADAVFIEIHLADPDGRKLRYEARTHPDANGTFEFRVPYATEGGRSQFRAEWPAEATYVRGNGWHWAKLHIPEAAVQAGHIIECRIP